MRFRVNRHTTRTRTHYHHHHQDHHLHHLHNHAPLSAADLSLIRSRVTARHYRSLEHFLEDVSLVFANCRAYNKPDTEYVACANKLQAFVAARVRAMQSSAAPHA